MNRFSGCVEKISNSFFWISGMSVVIMMMITVIDVIARLFRITVPGTYELVCFFNALVISFALGKTTFEKGHISVNLLIRIFPEKIQKTINITTNIFSLVFFSVLAWQLSVYADSIKNSGEVSATLQFPFYYFVFGVSAACFFMVLVLIHNLTKRLIIKNEI